MKSYTIECEKCGVDTKVKAVSEVALANWYSNQKKEGKDVLCRKCRMGK